MSNGNGGAFQNFIDNISSIKTKISKKQAYLGATISIAVYLISLFFAWSQARSGVDVSDSGSSSGWSEAGYIAIAPLAYVFYKVFKDKIISVKMTIILSSVSIALLFFDNVVERSHWAVGPQYGGILAPLSGANVGSDLGFGFWIGLISMLALVICGVAWAFHKEDEAKI